MTALQQAMADAQRKLDAAPKPQPAQPTSERHRMWLVLHKHPKGLTIAQLMTDFGFTESAARSGQLAMESSGLIRVADEPIRVDNTTRHIKRLYALGDAYVKPKPGPKAGQVRPRKVFVTGAVSVPASALPGPFLPDVGNMTVAQLQQMAENGRKAQAILADAAKLYEALGKILNG